MKKKFCIILSIIIWISMTAVIPFPVYAASFEFMGVNIDCGSAEVNYVENDLVVTFKSSGELTLTGGELEADVLVVGGGSSGSTGYPPAKGGNGGSGGYSTYNQKVSIGAGKYTVTVGAGGTGVTSAKTDTNKPGKSGGASSFIGEGDRVNISADGGEGKTGAGTDRPFESDITGESKEYGKAGSNKSSGGNGTSGTANTGNGGQGSGKNNGDRSGAGGSGIVIVRFHGAPEYDIENANPDTNSTTNNGYLTVDKAKSAAGGTVTIKVEPNTDYILKENTLKAIGETSGEACSLTQSTSDPSQYTFTMPTEKVTVSAEFEPAHVHEWSYSASGDTITATCSNSDGRCNITGNQIKLTLSAAGGSYDGTTSFPATTDNESVGFTSVTGTTIEGITYQSMTTSGGWSDPVDTAPTDVGRYLATINLKYGTNPNDYIIASKEFAVGKGIQNITASNQQVFNYGDTDKSVEASALDNAALSYSVKSGDSVSITADGKLTINKAGDTTVTVKAAETDRYSSTSKDITVSISKIDYTGMKVANGSVYSTAGIQTEIDLPELPEGAACETPTSESAYIASASVDNGKLKLTVGSEDIPPTATDSFTVTVPVKGAVNYKDYTITVTVTPKFHTHNFKYTVDSTNLAQLIATCTQEDCYRYHDSPLTLTMIAPSTSDLVYDGTPKEVSFNTGEKTAWEEAGLLLPDVTYLAATGSSLTGGKAVNAGSYTASISMGTATASLDFSITKATSSVTTAPTANSLTYNGEDQALVSAGAATGGAMNYAIGADASTAPTSGWSSTIPTGKNSGTYYVWYKSAGDVNHSDSTPGCITVNVAKKEVTVSGITATNRGYIKDDKTVTLVTTGATLTGKVDGDDLSVTATGEMADANAGENKSVTIKNLTLAGAGKDNYELASSGQQTSTTVTITKASHTVTAPTARNPVYNGNEQVLISAGNCATGEILYSFCENGTYTADINDIKAKAVGTYTVYYKVLGDGNYNEYTSKSLTAKIASKPTPTPDPPKPDPDPQPTPAPDPIKPTPTPEKPMPTPTPKNPIPVIPIEPKPTNTIPVIKLEDTEEETGESEVLGDITEIEETEKPDMGIKVRTMQVGKGNIRVDAETSETSPIQVANVETQIADLVDHSDIFTKEDVKEINSGADARVWINVDEMDMSIVSKEEQAEVLEIAKSLGGENEGLLYFDITLLKQVGSGDITSIHEPGMDIEVSLEIPETIRNTNPNVKREYSVIRIHDGKVKNLGGEYDEETGLIVFRTEKFSTYVLAYADKPIDTLEVISDTDSADAEVNSGMITPLSVILSLILLAGLGLIIFFVIRRKKQEEQ